MAWLQQYLRLAPRRRGFHLITAEIEAALIGSSVTVPIADGRLCLGTWQGIYLCEHRDRGGPRRIVLTVQGEMA